MTSSQMALGPPPCAKAPRFDTLSGKPIPNLFNAEVMAALRKRGGALWERGFDMEEDGGGPGGGGGAKDWSSVINAVEAMETTDSNLNYNQQFGLVGDEVSTKVSLTKTNLDVMTQQLVRIAQRDGEVKLKQFVDACVAGGLGIFSRKELEIIFKSVDTSGDGIISEQEWIDAVRGRTAE